MTPQRPTAPHPPTTNELGPRLRRVRRRERLYLELLLLVLLLVFAFMIPAIFFTVPSGHVGVTWSRFFGGTVTDEVKSEGMRMKWPWNKVFIYDLRLQQMSEEIETLSEDGLRLQVETTVRYRLDRRYVALLHKHVGPDYRTTLLAPELGAQVRNELSRFEPEEIYSEERAAIQERIVLRLRTLGSVAHLPGHMSEFLYVEDVMLRRIVLPHPVREAIEDKLAQRHMMLEYDYRILKEEKEALRKAIEAEGIRTFQNIVASGISEPYLKWKGIDATLELARSPNAKVVVIGAGTDGLPIILGGLEGVAGGAAAPGPLVRDLDNRLDLPRPGEADEENRTPLGDGTR